MIGFNFGWEFKLVVALMIVLPLLVAGIFGYFVENIIIIWIVSIAIMVFDTIFNVIYKNRVRKISVNMHIFIVVASVVVMWIVFLIRHIHIYWKG